MLESPSSLGLCPAAQGLGGSVSPQACEAFEMCFGQELSLTVPERLAIFPGVSILIRAINKIFCGGDFLVVAFGSFVSFPLSGP